MEPSEDAPQDPVAANARFVEENLKRNYVANFIHGVLGLTGFRLIYAPTIIPAYLQMLTGSAAAVGLGSALLQLGATISPIAAGTRIEHRSHILPYAIRIGTMMRVQILGLALTGWLLTGVWEAALVFLFLFVLGFFNGAQRVAFQMLMAKLIPIRKRGRLQGYRNLAGGAIAAVLAWVAGTVFIEGDVLGNGYATTFLTAFVLTSMGLVVLKTMIREPALVFPRPQRPFRERLREFPQLMEDRDFRFYLVAHSLGTAARVGAPFWTIYAGTRLGLDGALIGSLSLLYLGADTLSNVIWGNAGDRWGFRGVYAASLACSLAGVVLLLVAGGETAIYAAFVLLGAGGSGWMLAAGTMVLEFGEEKDTPMRLAFVTTVEGAIAALGPVLAGVTVALAGFVPLFGAIIVALLAALVVLLARVREPRHLPAAAAQGINPADP
ncbi:MFS transporter [Croceicoccus marinus]|uniref:MFS transporter n=1 Tax=Croceicoccus marinus TaxID=450378 RepID=A0A1Z1FGE7_9SPHN|nr:MFS transporter [Croceicoccus marinus]ARU17874.1 MFS transporter [Croceicoccus marinus]QNE07380.1 MFS transporter [Croceicoccus marinus]